jgi:hypothetical protein
LVDSVGLPGLLVLLLVSLLPFLLAGWLFSGMHTECSPREKTWAGKAARLASWRKMTQPGEICW